MNSGVNSSDEYGAAVAIKRVIPFENRNHIPTYDFIDWYDYRAVQCTYYKAYYSSLSAARLRETLEWMASLLQLTYHWRSVDTLDSLEMGERMHSRYYNDMAVS